MQAQGPVYTARVHGLWTREHGPCVPALTQRNVTFC